MSRLATTLILTSIPCVALITTPTRSWAHGGTYQGPVGGVPPGLRDPSDPVPPPPSSPPPPTTPPGSTPPGATPTPGPVTPGTPPAQPPPTVSPPDGPGGGSRRGPTIRFDDWTFWWAYESPAILHVKEAIYGLRISPRSGLDAMNGGGGRSDVHRLTEVSIRETMIPALLQVIDPKRRSHPDARSAAYLALARVTSEPGHIGVLLRCALAEGSASGEKDDTIVRESAALALGLLRRSEPTRQFDAKELDRVRDAAFSIAEDRAAPTRTRAFAALAIGLLGDQPTLRGREPTGEASASGNGTPTGPSSPASAPTAAERLFDDLGANYADADVPACLVLALGMQPPATVTLEMTEVLKDATLKSRLRGRVTDAITASYAALALGRVGGTEHTKTLALALEARTVPQLVKRSAAIGLGLLSARLEPDERRDLAGVLVRAIDGGGEPSTRAFAVIALARLLQFEAQHARTDAWSSRHHPDRVLLDLVEHGNGLRTYGALALGLVVQGVGERPDVIAQGEFRLAAIAALRSGLTASSVDPRSRGAFAVALGLAKDEASLRTLIAVLGDRTLDRELRSYAALAIGMIGEPSKDAVDAVATAMRESGSDELRLQSATALGLLGARDAVTILLRELADAETQAVTGQIVAALGRIGDDRAVAPLAALALDDTKPDVTRAMAVVGLGLVGDLEPVPTFSRISASFNYRACVAAIREFLSIL